MKTIKIVFILSLSMLIGLTIGYFFIAKSIQNKVENVNIKSVKQELKHLPGIHIPNKYTKQLDKSLKENGFIEEKICGMSVNGSNRSFFNNEKIHIHMYILNTNYYKNIHKALNSEFKRECKGKQTQKTKNKYAKYMLNKDAFIYCYSNKYNALEKEEYSRQIVIKLKPNIILTMSSIKFKNTNNRKEHNQMYYDYISKIDSDIGLLNKIFHDAEKLGGKYDK